MGTRNRKIMPKPTSFVKGPSDRKLTTIAKAMIGKKIADTPTVQPVITMSRMVPNLTGSFLRFAFIIF
jgi:hypothetical protein